MPSKHYQKLKRLANEHKDLHNKWLNAGHKGYPPLYFYEEHGINVRSGHKGPHSILGLTPQEYREGYKIAGKRSRKHPHAIHHLVISPEEEKQLIMHYKAKRKRARAHKRMRAMGPLPKATHIPELVRPDKSFTRIVRPKTTKSLRGLQPETYPIAV